MAWSRGRRGPAKPAQTSEEYAKQFAETLIKQIEEGTAPWQKTWEPGQRRMPRNIESEREYRGGNTLVLMATASSGRRLCMVNSQRRGEPRSRRASPGAPIECLPRPEYRLGSDDVPPAAGGDRGPAHLSGQSGNPLRGLCQSSCLMPGGPVPSTALAIPFPQGLPLSSGFVNDKIQTL